MEYRVNPRFEKTLSALTAEEYQALRNSLQENGYKGAPILTWHGYIVDGHNRYKICKELGIECPAEEIEFQSEQEVILWIIRGQLARRNMNNAQKIKLVLAYEPMLEAVARERQRQGGRDHAKISDSELEHDEPAEENQKRERKKKSERESEKENETENETEDEQNELMPKLAEANTGMTVNGTLAEFAGVSRETLRKCKKVLESGNEALIADMLNDNKSIHAAYKELQGLENSGTDQFEQIQNTCTQQLETIGSLLGFDYTNDAGENLSETFKAELLAYQELGTELFRKLSGAHSENGMIVLANL